MKRTPLTRRTPLKRGAMKSWNSTLPKQSAKKRKELRETHDVRRAAIEHGVLCDSCQKRNATDCHEIPAGAHRHRAVNEPRAQLWLCRECHENWQGVNYQSQVVVVVDSVIAAINRSCGSKVLSREKVIIALGGQPP